MELDRIERLLAARRKISSGMTARQLREAANYTQAEIAEKVGVTQAAMSRLEAGTRQPRPETLLRWAEVLCQLEKRKKRSGKSAA